MKDTTIRDLGDGLVLRRATAADAEALAAFNADHLREENAAEPDEKIGAWTLDLATSPPPGFQVGDFTIVEDTRRHEIVSSMCLIPQTWSYAGVEFPVGRPELVSTHPDYRRRGLIRAQFEVVHRWSAERGDKLLGITGIPWFYRQFGYEMCLDLWGGRIGYRADAPKLPEGAAEPFRLRPATERDLPLISELYDYGSRRSLLSCVRGEREWQYELRGRRPASEHYRELRVIERANGETVGFIAHGRRLHGNGLGLSAYELRAGVSWLAMTPTVVRYLCATGEELARLEGKSFETFGFWLNADHPAYQAAERLLPRKITPYSWYLRAPDLPGLLRRLAPVFERRLAESNAAGHTGTLKLSTYRTGVRMAFEQGRLTAVEPWTPTQADWGSAKFPDLTILHLIFGHRLPEDLEYAFADVGVRDDEARTLLHALFPKQPSNVWGLA